MLFRSRSLTFSGSPRLAVEVRDSGWFGEALIITQERCLYLLDLDAAVLRLYVECMVRRELKVACYAESSYSGVKLIKKCSQPKISVEKGTKPDILIGAGAQLRRPRINGARLYRVDTIR